MDRESLIRRLGDVAFVALLGGGLWLGGGSALAGLPRFLDAAMPGMAAQARPDDGLAHGTARFFLPDGFSESRHAPQVLYPVKASPFPEWLTQAMQDIQSAPLPAAPVARPVIAICIDDLGEDIAGTDKAMMLPKDVAMSFLPYAETTPFLAEAAAKRGHLILAHVPMQALGRSDPGPNALKVGMTQDEIARRVTWNLSRVPGLAGINNHEGSRFTANAPSLVPVASALKARHLFFFDSRTGPDTKVGLVSRGMGVMTAERDIFLDDDQSAQSVAIQLEMLARTAKRTGVAIAIGHPHDVTLKLLAAWLARDHGVTLVPLDEAMKLKSGRATAVAAR
jgi:polysaccharide deacetylase 2 family uncharacterized protein YibQ